MPLFIAADGGGTKTDFLLMDENRNVLNSVSVQGTNPRNIGKDKSIEIIREAISELSRGYNYSSISKAVLFIPVLWNYNDYVRSFFPFEVEVISDTKAALWAALGRNDGIVVSAGTGSFSIGKKDGKEILVGGWGPVISDSGGGFCIGKAVLEYAARTYDDGNNDLICDAVCRYFDVKSVNDLKKRQIDPDFLTVAKIAGLCRELKELPMGPVLKGIYRKAVSDLETLAAQCAARLNFAPEDSFPIWLCGGVLAENNEMSDALSDAMKSRFPNAETGIFNGRIIDGTIRYLFHVQSENGECFA